MTATQTSNPLDAFQWTPQPHAAKVISELADRFLAASHFTRKVARRLYDEAAVRFVDLIDSIHVPASDAIRDDLLNAGFVRRSAPGRADEFIQQRGIFPSVILRSHNPALIYLKVESAADFLAAWQNSAEIEGPPLGALRKARIAHSKDTEFWVIERHGYPGYEVPAHEPTTPIALLQQAEAFRRRRRSFSDEEYGFVHTTGLIDAAVAELGVSRACDLFFTAEREYWQRRNRAAQIQKARQDKLGIGWANHDHHTYRSSREHFAKMIRLFERLGFQCRERFYAGGEAGWGAQVLEQPETGIIIFADVDLSPDELFEDFAHEGLPPREALGTVGLWCALHGEAIFEAGMHHLESQFDFDALTKQLEQAEGVKVMKPFTNFPYLRQAFTQGETWPVRPWRIDRLLHAGRITEEQASHFRQHGAIGSHLENLERNQGFKGFNQTGVSEIIARTDPRAQNTQH